MASLGPQLMPGSAGAGAAAISAVLAVTLSACPPRADAPQESRMKTHEDRTLGLAFSYPDSFLIGRYAPDELPEEAVRAGMEPPFARAVVLIHPSQLGNYPLDAIPVGEVPAIWIDRPISALARRVFQADSTYEVGAMKVAKFPGFPGPYGDQAFYYIVEFPDGARYELAAHRFLWRTTDMEPTGYDAVIEDIIPTLERLED